jgi:epoxyqueuosine reductase
MGDWVFGCDICQIVCPWNKPGAEVSGILTEFIPRDELVNLDLVSELGLSPADFRTRFKGSSIKRTKRSGFLRNVAVALGNQKNEGALPALTQALADQEPLVRSHAAWALGEIGNIKAVDILKRRLDIETDPVVSEAIKDALDQIDPS